MFIKRKKTDARRVCDYGDCLETATTTYMYYTCEKHKYVPPGRGPSSKAITDAPETRAR